MSNILHIYLQWYNLYLRPKCLFTEKLSSRNRLQLYVVETTSWGMIHTLSYWTIVEKMGRRSNEDLSNDCVLDIPSYARTLSWPHHILRIKTWGECKVFTSRLPNFRGTILLGAMDRAEELRKGSNESKGAEESFSCLLSSPMEIVHPMCIGDEESTMKISEYVQSGKKVLQTIADTWHNIRNLHIGGGEWEPIQVQSLSTCLSFVPQQLQCLVLKDTKRMFYRQAREDESNTAESSLSSSSSFSCASHMDCIRCPELRTLRVYGESLQDLRLRELYPQTQTQICTCEKFQRICRQYFTFEVFPHVTHFSAYDKFPVQQCPLAHQLLSLSLYSSQVIFTHFPLDKFRNLQTLTIKAEGFQWSHLDTPVIQQLQHLYLSLESVEINQAPCRFESLETLSVVEDNLDDHDSFRKECPWEKCNPSTLRSITYIVSTERGKRRSRNAFIPPFVESLHLLHTENVFFLNSLLDSIPEREEKEEEEKECIANTLSQQQQQQQKQQQALRKHIYLKHLSLSINFERLWVLCQKKANVCFPNLVDFVCVCDGIPVKDLLRRLGSLCPSLQYLCVLCKGYCGDNDREQNLNEYMQELGHLCKNPAGMGLPYLREVLIDSWLDTPRFKSAWQKSVNEDDEVKVAVRFTKGVETKQVHSFINHPIVKYLHNEEFMEHKPLYH